MAQEMICPSCGEDEELHGKPADGDIQVTCLRCHAQWMRGSKRCASCGGTDIVTRPQAMTRHSRGTQLSIIGWRDIPLCRTCDADALQTSIHENTPVPGDYVAASLHGTGHRQAPAADRPAPTPAGQERTPPQAPAAKPPESAAPKPTTAPDTRQRRPVGTRPRQPRPRPDVAQVPTVRQAIAAFLAEASGDVDNTAMLLLGSHLGSYNRLSDLDEPGAAANLTQWCTGHWPDRHNSRHERARSTIRRAVDFWGARGWLAGDPAAGLRP